MYLSCEWIRDSIDFLQTSSQLQSKIQELKAKNELLEKEKKEMEEKANVRLPFYLPGNYDRESFRTGMKWSFQTSSLMKAKAQELFEENEKLEKEKAELQEKANVRLSTSFSVHKKT